MAKTYEEINEKIRRGDAVVVTAEEMIGVVRDKGVAAAARDVDVVTTGTFGPMCSSGALLNVGHTTPRMKIQRARLNGVEAYGGFRRLAPKVETASYLSWGHTSRSKTVSRTFALTQPSECRSTAPRCSSNPAS